jgi:hypothetical protein
VLLNVKYGKCLVGDKRKRNLTQNRKYRFPFEKWILRNGQPVRDDNHIIFVAMTATLEKRRTYFFLKTRHELVYRCAISISQTEIDIFYFASNFSFFYHQQDIYRI